MAGENTVEAVYGMNSEQDLKLKRLMKNIYKTSSFYRNKLKEIDISPEDIKGVEDLHKLPFTEKEDLRNNSFSSFQTVPDEKIVRVHSSSGTTGRPIIIPYTEKDVNDWTDMMARCFQMVGVGSRDKVQITPGYGLWTAGIGFQAGAEKLGAMAVPTGPGNTERQFNMMTQLGSSVLVGTSSYGLLLAEEAEKRGLVDEMSLRLGVFGSERWGEKMRARIEKILGIDTYDIYGLTEIYGPGIAIDCACHEGLHYWDDYFIFEIIDPLTGKQVSSGERGELVITTLQKEGMPLLRYRTRDITKIIPARCSCGSPYPMIDRIIGRSDDMIKIKGVQVYPADIDNILKNISDISSEYQIILNKNTGRDDVQLKVEKNPESPVSSDEITLRCRQEIKNNIGISLEVEVVDYASLPRSEKKSQRVIDKRELH